MNENKKEGKKRKKEQNARQLDGREGSDLK